mmetsp:Transcript_34593/g.86928  ORF Transcript_34593/g.86928 Transcript_34593/m.86928 type:complete len:122 (-) Transcript_34593:1519-1884(-)
MSSSEDEEDWESLLDEDAALPAFKPAAPTEDDTDLEECVPILSPHTQAMLAQANDFYAYQAPAPPPRILLRKKPVQKQEAKDTSNTVKVARVEQEEKKLQQAHIKRREVYERARKKILGEL